MIFEFAFSANVRIVIQVITNEPPSVLNDKVIILYDPIKMLTTHSHTTKLRMSTLLAFVFLVLPVLLFAQSGPGGVSNDADIEKNCRLWLNAGDLASPTQPDGSEVTRWYDKSKSAIKDSAVWVANHNSIPYVEFFSPPLYRSDPAYSINGQPVVSFDNGGMLLIGLDANADLNLDLVSDATGVTKQRTIFIAFRTPSDITSRQFLWEQGGGWRGLGIYIYDSHLYIGVYDIEGLGFGYSYKRTSIQPNTTYVVSLVLNAGDVIDTNEDNQSFIGTLNGESFGLLELGAGHPTKPGNGFGVGKIKKQGDPIGIGGVNSMVAHESSIYDWSKNANNNPCRGHQPCDYSFTEPFGLTGYFRFKGRIAEIAYYAYSLNAAERIIVENYLAAKYFANVIANDKFQYKANYGNDVIGIGAEYVDGAYQKHNISKGDNIFEMSVKTSDWNNAFEYGSPQSRYLLTGHNNNPLVWTTQNTPDSATVQRLRRTWRFDRSGIEGGTGNQSVVIKFHPDSISDFPALPAGYKYAVMIDTLNGALPNFASSSTVLTEIVFKQGTGLYEGDFNIPHGAYLTFAAVKPTIQFKKSTEFALEGNPPPSSTPKTVEVELNYNPRQQGAINTGVIFKPLSAQHPVDFDYPTTNISIPQLSRTGTIAVNIKNDEVPDTPPVKKFLMILNQNNTDNGFYIGKRDTLEFSIYDDDSEPKASFTSAENDTITEAAGLADIQLRINSTSNSGGQIVIIDKGPSTPIQDYAIKGLHYDLPPADGWITSGEQTYRIVDIPAGTNAATTISFPIYNLGINDYDKKINFILEPLGDLTVDGSSIIEHTLIIKNVNPEPTVEFLAASSEGFRVVAQPRIVVKLSKRSGKQIQVPFKITGGTAVNGAYEADSDYNAVDHGMVIFPPGDTISYLYYDPETGNIPIQVYAGDETGTIPDKTIIFELKDPVTNAGLGNSDMLEHIYTIKDYVPFEWMGAAGVGRLRDNTFWINFDGTSTAHTIQNLPQISPQPISIRMDNNNHKAEVIHDPILNKNVLWFSNDRQAHYIVRGAKKDGESPFINTGGSYDSKSIFFVFKPELPTNEATPQVIYEEGGTDKGLSIYLKNKKLYFQAWNITDDDGPEGDLAPWGGNDSYAVSSTLSYGQYYVVSCHYKRQDEGVDLPGLTIFINGDKVGGFGNTNTPDPSEKVGRLYVHNKGIGLGGMRDDTRFESGPVTGESGNYFKGILAEFIYFNESGHAMNTSRIRILHNYLSARFNIPLTQGQVFNLHDIDYNYQVAGIGRMSEKDLHAMAQGTTTKGESELKVSAPSLSGTEKFLMWGHNGKSFTDTWQYSYHNAPLPAPVVERSGRVWKFFSNGTADFTNLNIEIDFSESANAGILSNNRNWLKLLVNNNPDDWSNASVINASTSPADPGRVKFENVTIPVGAYITLGNTSPRTVAPLPIELLSFTAKLQMDHVNLQWITSTEHNNDYFVVERAGEDLKWENILTVPGAGFSNREIFYFEKDRNPLSGISYYRLKQVDFDGSYSYSDIVSVLNTKAGDKKLVSIYPNPAEHGHLFLKIPNELREKNLVISIFDMRGRKVWSENIIPQHTDLEMNYGNLGSGIYLLEIISQDFRESKKLVIR